MTMTICSSMATPTAPCPTTGTYCTTDDPAECLVQVRLTYRSDHHRAVHRRTPLDRCRRSVRPERRRDDGDQLMRGRDDERGQILVVFAILIAILLAFAGVHHRHRPPGRRTPACPDRRRRRGTGRLPGADRRRDRRRRGAGRVRGRAREPPELPGRRGRHDRDAADLRRPGRQRGDRRRRADQRHRRGGHERSRGRRLDRRDDARAHRRHHDARHRRPCALQPPGRAGRPDRRAALRKPRRVPAADSSTTSRRSRRAARARSTRVDPRGYDGRTPASEAGARAAAFAIYGPRARRATTRASAGSLRSTSATSRASRRASTTTASPRARTRTR